jgi:Kef-type K+ transport system membrane component KefB
MFETVFVQIGVIVGIAALAGVVAQWLRQPLIVAFIAVGILLGPSAIGIV